MAAMRRVWAVALSSWLVGCVSEGPAEPHVLVYVDTDAPLPASDEHGAPQPALFDTLEVRVVTREGKLKPTENSATVTREMFPVSFAVVGSPQLQVSLSHHSHLGTEAQLASDLTVRVQLPAATPEGAVASVFLSTALAGKPQGLEEPVTPMATKFTDSRVGTWRPDAQTSCEHQRPQAEEVCVPGGVFWQDAADGIQHLTVMPAFYLDRSEATVEAYRATRDAGALEGLVEPPLGAAAADALERDARFATFSDPPRTGDRRNHTLNGVYWQTACAYCNAHQQRLPTVAELEYVAEGMGRGWSYPWGAAAADCDDVIVARAGIGSLSDKPGNCRKQDVAWGPTEPRQGRLDVVYVADAGVFDLAGNVREWTRDKAEPAGEITAPSECITGDTQGHHFAHGGSFVDNLADATSASRHSHLDLAKDVAVGFRCARDL